jgi:acyl-CoA reductase-like NAD-dependent aldehyde dehydrogenase
MKNTAVAKTVKLFIGGEFPRTESGRTTPVYFFEKKSAAKKKSEDRKVYAQICRASRKDFRNAVTAAREALSGWEHRSAYNRSQIIYRMAEMMEGKRAEFADILAATLGYTAAQSEEAVSGAIDALVYFSGFCDKFQQVMGSVNPVSGPHHNFTTAEGVGVVSLIGDEQFSLPKLVAQIAAVISTGSSLVAVLADDGAAVLAPLAEVFATSDLPKGVINLLTGSVEELYKHIGSHMEVQSISYQGHNAKLRAELTEMAAENMKRVVGPIAQSLSLDHLLKYVEYKTAWHPVGK